MSWLATQLMIGIGQRLVIQDAVEWLVFEAFVERLLVLSLRSGQSMILDTRKRRKSAAANALISQLPPCSDAAHARRSNRPLSWLLAPNG